MMWPVRRPIVALAGLVLLASAVVTGVGADAAAAGAAAAGAGVGVAGTGGAAGVVRTVLGPGALDGPGGIALSADGNLFVADAGHCRVLVVPARTGLLDGLHVRAGRTSTLAGGSCTGRGALGRPSDVAVDSHGDLFIAEATAQRVQEVRAGSHTVVTVAGTGTGGFNGDGRDATASELDEPTGVAADGAGDLFIADTANCRVRVVPAATGTLFGQAVRAAGLFTVAGTGICGSTGQGGPLRTAQLWDPVAVTLDTAGDLLVADSGDQSVLLAPSGGSGTFYGSSVGAGDIGVVVGGTGSYGPYVVDGLPANGPTAELNDPRGLAIGPTGALFVTDGFMHVIRVVPAAGGTLLGTTVKTGDLYTVAGALPVATAAGTNDGTKWVRAHVGTPVGIAVSPSGALFYADAAQDTVRVLGTGAGAGAGST
jgi:sugar lactone lactonase YvrE